MQVKYATARAMVPLAGGGQALVVKGSHWPADDPVVLAQPSLFSDDPRWGLNYSAEPAGWGEPPVEQATAAPGEKRNTRRAG
jgi:hypothetical protein